MKSALGIHVQWANFIRRGEHERFAGIETSGKFQVWYTFSCLNSATNSWDTSCSKYYALFYHKKFDE